MCVTLPRPRVRTRAIIKKIELVKTRPVKGMRFHSFAAVCSGMNRKQTAFDAKTISKLVKKGELS